MKLQLPNCPILKQFKTTVPPDYYNPIRLAQLHTGEPIELILGARGLGIHLDHHTWLVSDRNLGEIPLLAWHDIKPLHRRGLHRPVPCELVYYHAYAAVVVRTVLADVIPRLPRTEPPARSATLLPFPL